MKTPFISIAELFDTPFYHNQSHFSMTQQPYVLAITRFSCCTLRDRSQTLVGGLMQTNFSAKNCRGPLLDRTILQGPFFSQKNRRQPHRKSEYLSNTLHIIDSAKLHLFLQIIIDGANISYQVRN